MLPEMLRFLSSYRMLIYAIVLILIMLVSNNASLKVKMEKWKQSMKGSREGAEKNA